MMDETRKCKTRSDSSGSDRLYRGGQSDLLWSVVAERHVFDSKYIYPFTNYSFPARILWRGHLVITRSGRYQFFVHSRGKKGKTNDPSKGLFTTPCAKLFVDGKAILSNPKGVVEDTYPYMRIDYSEAIELEAGLHEVLLESEVESADPKFGMGPHNKDRKPCVRLYWSSEHFLRELVPADHLMTMN